MRNSPKLSAVSAIIFVALGTACARRSATQNASPGNTTSEAALPELTIDALSAMIDRGESVAVFDANGRPRYEEGHIPGARHVGHDAITAAALPPDHATPLVFYCYNER